MGKRKNRKRDRKKKKSHTEVSPQSRQKYDNLPELKIHFKLAQSALRAGNTEVTYKLYEKCLLLSSPQNRAETYYNMSVLRCQQKRYEEALMLVDQALEIRNEVQDYHKLKAQCCISLKRYEEALVHYEILFRMTPDELNLLIYSLHAHRVLGHLDQIKNLLEHTEKHHPSSPSLAYEKCCYHLAKGEFEKAKAVYKLEDAPNELLLHLDPLSYLSYTQACYQNGDYVEAYKYAVVTLLQTQELLKEKQILVILDVTRLPLHAILSDALIVAAQARHEIAGIESTIEFLSEYTMLVESSSLLLLTYNDLIKNHEAHRGILASNCAAILALKPRQTRAWLKLHEYFTLLNDPQQAEACLLKAHALDPDNIALSFTIGKLYLDSQETEKAAPFLALVCRANPENLPIVHKYLACLKSLGKTKEILKVSLSALKHHPTDLDLLLTVASHYERGHNQKALTYYDRILSIKPDDVEPKKQALLQQEKRQAQTAPQRIFELSLQALLSPLNLSAVSLHEDKTPTRCLFFTDDPVCVTFPEGVETIPRETALDVLANFFNTYYRHVECERQEKTLRLPYQRLSFKTKRQADLLTQLKLHTKPHKTQQLAALKPQVDELTEKLNVYQEKLAGTEEKIVEYTALKQRLNNTRQTPLRKQKQKFSQDLKLLKALFSKLETLTAKMTSPLKRLSACDLTLEHPQQCLATLQKAFDNTISEELDQILKKLDGRSIILFEALEEATKTPERLHPHPARLYLLRSGQTQPLKPRVEKNVQHLCALIQSSNGWT